MDGGIEELQEKLRHHLKEAAERSVEIPKLDGSQGGPAKVWPGAEGTGSSTLSDHLLSNGEIIIQLHSRWPFD